MSKRTLLFNLQNDVYCRLAPSKIHGIGVVAIKDIPINTYPFRLNGGKTDEVIVIQKNEIQDLNLDKEVIKLLNDFTTTEKTTYFSVPKYGLNAMNISFYLNHSSTPNVDIVNDANSDYFSFRTNRLIQKGEELTINYSLYD